MQEKVLLRKIRKREKQKLNILQMKDILKNSPSIVVLVDIFPLLVIFFIILDENKLEFTEEANNNAHLKSKRGSEVLVESGESKMYF